MTEYQRQTLKDRKARIKAISADIIKNPIATRDWPETEELPDMEDRLMMAEANILSWIMEATKAIEEELEKSK